MGKYIEAKDIKAALEFRHACKAFDAGRKISDEEMALILEAARMAPSSFGFEQWNIIVAQDEQLRGQLKKVCGMNKARFDASHFLIFTAKTDAAIDGHIKHMLREVKGMNAVAATAYKTFWKQWAKKDFRLFDGSGRVHDWAARQAYIALGFVMLAAAERGVDSCPIEGFSVEGATEVLTDFKLIDSKNDLPVVMLALGYRADKPKHPHSRREMDEVARWY